MMKIKQTFDTTVCSTVQQNTLDVYILFVFIDCIGKKKKKNYRLAFDMSAANPRRYKLSSSILMGQVIIENFIWIRQ